MLGLQLCDPLSEAAEIAYDELDLPPADGTRGALVLTVLPHSPAARCAHRGKRTPRGAHSEPYAEGSAHRGLLRTKEHLVPWGTLGTSRICYAASSN